MCFFHDDDYAWTASVSDEETRTAGGPVQCLECCDMIGPGEVFTQLFLQQHEECRRCEDECSDWYEPNHPECAGGEHDYGETYTHRTCERCQKLLEAIQRVEEDEGCSGSETRPELGKLREAFWESDSAVAYIDRARTEYPELAMSGYLDEFYQLTHEYDREVECRWDEDDVGPTDELGGEG